MSADQMPESAQDEYRERIHWLIDRALDAEDDQNEKRRWLILLCREIGAPELPDRGIVEDVIQAIRPDCVDGFLIEGRPYTDRQLQVAVRSARRRGVSTEAIRSLIRMFTDTPGHGLTTMEPRDRGAFLSVLGGLMQIVSSHDSLREESRRVMVPKQLAIIKE